MTVQAIPVAIQPLVGWPHEAEQGRTYLVTVDLRLAAGAVWPYEEEEYPVYCLLGTGPTCSLRPLGTSALILHRYGGTYGPARFLLTALEPTDDAKLRLSVANRWGVPILALPLPMRIVSMSEEAPRAARDELRENVVVGTTGVGAEPSAPPTEPFGFNPNSIGFFGIIDWNYTRSLEPANVGNVQVVQELRHQRWVDQNELDKYVAEEERNNPGSPCPTLVGYEEDTRESANDVQLILKIAFSRYSEHVAIRRYLRDHKSEYDSVVRQILNGDLRQIISHSPTNIVINVTIMSRDGKVMLMRRPASVRTWPLFYQVGLHETMNWPAPGDLPENCFQLATRALAEEVNLTDPRDYYNRIVFSWFGYYAVEASAYFFAHVKTRLSERQLMESVSKAQSALFDTNIEWMDLTKDNVRSVLQTWSNGPWEPGRDDHGWQYLPHSVMSLTQLYRITRQGMLPLLEVASIDANLLATAQGWIEAATYTEERDYLSAHEELLDHAADNAVDEVLLTVEETEAERYRGLRMVAQAQGVEAAYRPLLLRTLADEFIGADLARRRALLLERRSDLLSDIVAAVLEDRVGAGDTDRVESARALLELAARDEERPVLDALEDPARFPDLLYNLAKVNSRGLAPAAMVASTVASTQAEAAVARFFLAIASAINGDGDTAREVIAEAHQLDPSQSAEWIVQLAELGQQQPAVLPLIAVLTTPHPPA